LTERQYCRILEPMNAKRKTTESKQEGGEIELIQRSVWADKDVWIRARKLTAGERTLSEVVRILLRAWVDGKIDLEDLE